MTNLSAVKTPGKSRAIRSLNTAVIKPYSELRKDFFRAGDLSAVRGKASARPPRLDKRLSAARLEDLRLYGHSNSKKAGRGFEAYIEVMESIRAELAKLDQNNDWYELLSPARCAVLLADTLEAEVNNGGFDQYFLNSSGDGAHLAPGALRFLELRDIAKMAETANAQFPRGPSPARQARLAQMERLPKSASAAWRRLDRRFFRRKPPSATDVCVRFILEHPSEFFKI